jgi:transcriptional regulator with XRE-family HTH domain
MIKVKETLARILNERGMKVSSLAKFSGVSKSNIQTWLTGSKPSIEQLDKVAKALGVSFEYLAFGRSEDDKLQSIFDKIVLHSGTYEISVKKISNRNGDG